jgi:hypothetical protein
MGTRGKVHDEHFISKDLEKYETSNEYKRYNIIQDRLKLYKDFILNLCYNVSSTYLGQEFVKTKSDIEGHYAWCFNKTVEDFEKCGISFRSNQEIYNYFLEYFSVVLYYEVNLTDYEIFKKYWNDLFNQDMKKANHELEEVIEIYGHFDETMKQKKLDIDVLD